MVRPQVGDIVEKAFEYSEEEYSYGDRSYWKFPIGLKGEVIEVLSSGLVMVLFEKLGKFLVDSKELKLIKPTKKGKKIVISYGKAKTKKKVVKKTTKRRRR